MSSNVETGQTIIKAKRECACKSKLLQMAAEEVTYLGILLY